MQTIQHTVNKLLRVETKYFFGVVKRRSKTSPVLRNHVLFPFPQSSKYNRDYFHRQLPNTRSNDSTTDHFVLVRKKYKQNKKPW